MEANVGKMIWICIRSTVPQSLRDLNIARRCCSVENTTVSTAASVIVGESTRLGIDNVCSCLRSWVSMLQSAVGIRLRFGDHVIEFGQGSLSRFPIPRTLGGGSGWANRHQVNS